MKFNTIDKAIDRLLMTKGDISYHIDDLEIKKTINNFKHKVENNFGVFIILSLILLIIKSFQSIIALITLSTLYLVCIIIISKYTNSDFIKSKIKPPSLSEYIIMMMICPILVLTAFFSKLIYSTSVNKSLLEEDFYIEGVKHIRKINYIGTESYYLNGKLNREDGHPAYLNYETYIYCLNGKEITKIYKQDVDLDLIYSKSHQNKMREKIKKAKIANKLDGF